MVGIVVGIGPGTGIVVGIGPGTAIVGEIVSLGGRMRIVRMGAREDQAGSWACRVVFLSRHEAIVLVICVRVQPFLRQRV